MSFSNLLERANGSLNMLNNGQPPAFASAGPSRIPPAPPAPPPPPPLPVFNMQSNSASNNNSTMDAGPSNFNAGFDFGSTYAVASSNYDTPFLSASESNWLFNHADLQFDTPMPQATAPPMSNMSSNAPPAPPPPPPLPTFMQNQNQQMLQSQPSHPQHQQQQRGNMSPFANNQNLSNPTMQNNNSNGQQPPIHPNFSMPPTSSSFPSSLSGILNPAHRRSRHVHFADAQAFQQSQIEANNHNNQSFPSSLSDFHPPLAPLPNGAGNQYQNSYTSNGTTSNQNLAPRVIRIGLATRNRLAKHLAVCLRHPFEGWLN